MLGWFWKQFKTSSPSPPATISLTLSTSSFCVETMYANLKSESFLHIFLCRGRGPSLLKKKLKMQLFNTIPHFLSLSLQNWADFCFSPEGISLPLYLDLFFFPPNSCCRLCTVGLLAMLPSLSFMPPTLPARSSWTSSPCSHSGSSGRGMQDMQLPAKQERISLQSVIHSAVSMCCTCPFLLLERKWNNYTACKKHALWLTFMIKLQSCCNEIYHQYIKPKQNQCGSKKTLIVPVSSLVFFCWVYLVPLLKYFCYNTGFNAILLL